ncbi:hypothetical protein DFS34DRAFT_578699 [Phlyctochytrium arcticum]|nr:hypothetical protein DFS34DRAFT_578699 [Phlyctochytrium arcticum]
MTRTTTDLERALLLGRLPKDFDASSHPASSLVSLIIEGKYVEIFRSPSAKELFGDLRFESLDALITDLSTRLTAFAAAAGPDRQFEILLFGVAALYSFLQAGWTGPNLDKDLEEVFPSPSTDLRKEVLKFLEADAEEVYSLTTQPLLLVFAKLILFDNVAYLSDLPSAVWWSARCVFKQQQLLENPTDTLRVAMFEAFEAAEKHYPDGELAARIQLEKGLAYHWFELDAPSLESFKAAQAASHFKWNMSGALGRRTKFQDFDISQLVVLAESAPDDAAEDAPVEQLTLPQTLDLNDDTLLEKISFTKSESTGEGALTASNQGNLRVIDQCILLAFCMNVKNTNPEDGMTIEEMKPYVQRVLEHPNNWMVHTMALLLRSRLESKKSRTVERAALQLQALVDQIVLEEPSPAERMQHIFSILIPPKWEMERELGERFLSIGATRSALEIFERLEMWEDIISCHQMLDQDKKAEAIVHERLLVTPNSPKLHCILGDLKKDPSYYEKAWKLSDGRYARAMRSLGVYYFKKEEWTKSIECYHRALAINALFVNSWFVMGCAAMRVEEWDQAVRAFSRVTSIDHTNGEAWTNLASVYVRQKKKREAWRALREAVKQQFDNAKIWENYLYTSVDLGEFQEAMHSMERVLEERLDKAGEKNPVIDVEILDILVTAVTSDLKDANGQPSSRLAGRLNALITKVCSKVANNPNLYSCAARFAALRKQYRKSLDFRLKAYRCLLHHPHMADQEDVFKATAAKALELVQAYVEDGPRMEAVRMGAQLVCKDWAYQAKMVLKTLIGRTRTNFEDHPTHDELKDKLTEITNLSTAA